MHRSRAQAPCGHTSCDLLLPQNLIHKVSKTQHFRNVKVSQISASQIKALTGSAFQKYVCTQQFDGQDEDQFGIFWALLVHFGLGIMCEKGICKI